LRRDAQCWREGRPIGRTRCDARAVFVAWLARALSDAAASAGRAYAWPILTLWEEASMSTRSGFKRIAPRNTGGLCGLASVVLTLAAGSAAAKEGHLEDMKLALVETRITCATCHPDPEGRTLTDYGRRIADLGAATSVQERVKEMERRPTEATLKLDAEGERRRTDIDGDGVLNWVEILAGSDPSNAEDPPNRGKSPEFTALRTKIETVVSCALCHVDAEVKPIGADKAPHNPLGEALAKLAAPKPGVRPADAAPPPVMTRFKSLENVDTDKDKARNWHEIVTFHSPTDAADTPTDEELKAVRKMLQDLLKPNGGFGRVHREGGR
jgi:hypothetical protein